MQSRTKPQLWVMTNVAAKERRRFVASLLEDKVDFMDDVVREWGSPSRRHVVRRVFIIFILFNFSFP